MTPSLAEGGRGRAVRRGRLIALLLGCVVSAVVATTLATAPSPARAEPPTDDTREAADRSATLGPRLLNGSPAAGADFPSVVLVRAGAAGPRCTGTVVGPRWVLTAAHCFRQLDPAAVRIHLGGDRLDRPFAQTTTARQIVLHPGFVRDPLRADLALVELRDPTSISPVRLAQDGTRSPVGSRATMVGWGMLDEDTPAVRLHRAELPVRDAQLCLDIWPQRFDPNTELCLGGERSMACPGDSGGPLLITSGVHVVQVGVASAYSPPCAAGSALLSMASSVGVHRYWIDAVLAGSVIHRIDGVRVRFWDVGPDHAHRAGIHRASLAGVADGYLDGSFRPAFAVTRGQLATTLTRALELPDPGGGSFADVPAGHTHHTGIRAAHAAGLVRGFPDGTFRPEQPVTRGQLASVLRRALGLAPGPLPTRYLDVPITDPHAAAISAVTGAGLMTGFADGTFRPGQPVTRGQLASVLARSVLAADVEADGG